MAVVRQFIPGHQTIRPHRTEVDCYHQVVDGASPRVHLSTFGSDERKSKSKSSQSIQIDESGARELIEILENAFPALRRRR